MRIAVLLITLLLSFAAAQADNIADAKSVIRAQEQAFARDDAAAAYSYAAPAIRKIFPAADIFMAMVESAYAPIYRHKSFEFGETKVDGDWIGQYVHIIDANNEAWDALYTLEQQSDGSYKITGCSLSKAGQAV
ncbi:DUF4864 domain-containing protein [Bradyrhizobium sp. UFLA05-109]